MPNRTHSQQPDMFPTGEDLPLFSGAPVRIIDRLFDPSATDSAQPALLDLRPTFGNDEPSYAPAITNLEAL